MHHKHIIQSLPLLASILGRKYGVEVRIGGDSAYTDGNVIQLPSLPSECGKTLLGLVRGYIDHESAHIRHTDFLALKRANLTVLGKHIWNAIEDWRVENQLAAVYPGCRQNFAWLIRYFFLEQQSNNNQPTNPAENILSWLLLMVRSWDVSELQPQVMQLQADVEYDYPGLTNALLPVLQQIRGNCSSTQEAIVYTQKILAILQQYIDTARQKQNSPHSTGQSEQSTSGQSAMASPTEQCSPQVLQNLQIMLTSGASGYSGDMGDALQEALSSQSGQLQGQLGVAIAVPKDIHPLPLDEIDRCRQATTALRTRLQAFLQSTQSVKNTTAYIGKLNTHKLYKLSTGNSKIFLRSGERQTLNTAIHILLDSSGSMLGQSMTLANQACFAVASALQGIKGINVGVTTFPGGRIPKTNNPGTASSITSWNTVCPILQHNQAMHTNFNLVAAGDTPMDAALLWTLQLLYPLPEKRKMILIITDGSPNDYTATEKAITMVRQHGIEIYGIGIADASITQLLPGKESKIIQSITDLAPAMFGLLQDALMAK